MKYLLVFNTKEPETVWNGLRFGSAALGRAHQVNLFLLGPGVEIESIDNERFDVQEQLAHFHDLGGAALSCGTCLSSRHLDAAAACQFRPWTNSFGSARKPTEFSPSDDGVRYRRF